MAETPTTERATATAGQTEQPPTAEPTPQEAPKPKLRVPRCAC